MPGAINVGAIPDHIVLALGGDPLVLADDFTDAAGTLLSTHIPLRGDSWNIESGSIFDSTGNAAALQSGQAGVNYAWMDGISSNLTLQCVVTAGAAGQYSGVVYHLTDTGNTLEILFQATGALFFNQNVATVRTTVTSISSDLITFSSGVAYTLRIESDGSTLDIYVNSTLELSTNDTGPQTGTGYGIFQFDNITPPKWDTFRVSKARGVLA